MTTKTITLVKTILDAFEELKLDMDTISKKIKDCNSEQEDLLHELELTKFNACEGYLLAKEIQTLRHKRREYKDLEEQLDLLKLFMNKHKWVINDLKPLIKVIEEKKEHQIHRQYTPRIRSNLKSIFIK